MRTKCPGCGLCSPRNRVFTAARDGVVHIDDGDDPDLFRSERCERCQSRHETHSRDRRAPRRVPFIKPSRSPEGFTAVVLFVAASLLFTAVAKLFLGPTPKPNYPVGDITEEIDRSVEEWKRFRNGHDWFDRLAESNDVHVPPLIAPESSLLKELEEAQAEAEARRLIESREFAGAFNLEEEEARLLIESLHHHND